MLVRMLVSQLVARLHDGRTSVRDLVVASLQRADRAQRELNALITVSKDVALARADALDARLRAGEAPGPLFGIPVVVKDNICTEGVRTTAASRSLARFVPPYSATVVERLEAAGAVMVAKANLDEFGMGGSNENSAFGAVRNPWDPDRVPGGSSGGAAAAVAAGVAPLALGTDTGGSVRQPAAFCGVLGFKPTYGRLSRYGVIAFASSLDQVGVLARCASDAALALDAMHGHDPRDATSVDAPADLGSELDLGVAGLRIGLVNELSGEGNSAEVLEGLARSRAALERLGAEVGEVSLPHARYGVPAYYLVATAEASSNLARFDGMIYSERRGEDALGQGEVMMRSRGETLGGEVRRRVLMGTYALSAGYYDAYYGRALKVRRLIADDFDRAFEAFDLLLAPTAPSAAYRLGERVDDPLAMYLGDVATCLANLAGLPALSVPAGVGASGLPVGVQLFAPALADARLLRAAAALEGEAVGDLAPLAPDWRA
jgi:aspartyl-tRNA(Asn)/glutamyl-tRNA(Gln) amidotransferase subunit A